MELIENITQLLGDDLNLKTTLKRLHPAWQFLI
jgi:predicted  nucleic acid-binding Zn ribbon protein